jgi:uncharacterized protein Yka (UPF0111/DUF47 family)
MKTKTLLLSIFACLFVLALTSCNKVIDVQIAALEKSIDKLDDEYKNMTPNEIEKAINVVEKQIDALEERKDDMTREQGKKFANLQGRYTKLLVKIELYLMVDNIFEGSEVEKVIEYIKGLLGANA